MTAIQIPQTWGEARESLNGLGKLLTAKEWERAAIIGAFVVPSKANGTSITSDGSRMTVEDFAAEGIIGLKSVVTVRLYRQRWEEHGYPIAPGEEVTLPEVKWPPNESDTDEGRGRIRISPVTPTERVSEAVANMTPLQKEAAIEALTSDPVVEAAMVDALVAHPDILDKADKILRDQTPDVPERPEQKLSTDRVMEDVASEFGTASRRIEEATRLLEKARLAGLHFDDLQFRALAALPETYLDEVLISYRKMVAMVPTESEDEARR